MKKNYYLIKDIQTNKISVWNLDQILDEINRDRSNSWQPYNKKDWLEGWNEWVEGNYYKLKYNRKKETRHGKNESYLSK